MNKIQITEKQAREMLNSGRVRILNQMTIEEIIKIQKEQGYIKPASKECVLSLVELLHEKIKCYNLEFEEIKMVIKNME